MRKVKFIEAATIEELQKLCDEFIASFDQEGAADEGSSLIEVRVSNRNSDNWYFASLLYEN